jgi:hypothetical protein
VANAHTAILRRYRDFAHRMVDAAPDGSVLSIKAPRRTIPQNDLMWAMLTQISAAKPEGRTLTPDVWKALFMHSLDHAQRFEMALDGNGMVPVGFRSSKLTKEQMSDLIEMMLEYAARHDIAIGIEARSGETGTGSTVGESPAPEGDRRNSSKVIRRTA